MGNAYLNFLPYVVVDDRLEEGGTLGGAGRRTAKGAKHSETYAVEVLRPAVQKKV